MAKVKINKDLLEKAKTVAEERGYASVEEFINHLVEKEVTKLDSANEQDEVKKRLQGLGYIS